MRRLALALVLSLLASPALAQYPAGAENQSNLALVAPTAAVSDNSGRIATTAWVNNFFNLGIPLANGKIFIGSAGGVATAQTMSGDCTLVATGVITCTQAAGNFQVIGNLSVGGSIIDGNGILATNIAAPATPAAGTTRIYVDSTTKVLTFKNDAGTVGNAVVPATCGANLFGTSISAAGVFGCTQPAVSNISGFGTGVATALGVNIGSAGAPVLFNGAGGTPSSMVGTNITGTAAGLTAGTASAVAVGGITGLGAGCATWLGTPSSANLRGCVSDESGTGLAYFQGGDLGTPSAGVLTNASGTAASLTAGNATKLATARAIGIAGSTGLTATGVNFDGTAAINPALTGTLVVANGGTGDTGTAWAAYTPTLSCGSGTLTTSSATGAFKQIGKTVFVRFVASITTNGTCAGSLIVTLPVAPVTSVDMMMSVRDFSNGSMGAGRINSALGTNITITRFDGVYLPTSGSAIAGTGVYEAN